MHEVGSPGPEGDPLEHPSLVELTTDRLRGDILAGVLAPGDRLVEDTLRRQYGISRAPLREALRLLAQQGLVEHLPRRGARVTTWSPTDIRQLFQVRSVLEQHAVISALPLRGREGDPLAPVRRRLAQMRAAAEDGDDLAKDDAHRAFHAAVVALADNRQLELALAPVLVKLQLPMAVNLRRETSEQSAELGLARHAALVEALETDDVQVVLEALRGHGELGHLHLD